MASIGGTEATREIMKACPAVKVLILFMHKMKEYVVHTLYAGVDGYLLKDDTDVNLCCIIETIRKGGIYGNLSANFSGFQFQMCVMRDFCGSHCISIVMFQFNHDIPKLV